MNIAMAVRQNREHSPTLRDVAMLAGVSVGSVSHALRPGGRHVSSATRTRVLDAAAQLGYKPSGRGRRPTRPLVVGAIVPDATNSFFSDTLRSIETVLRPGGHRLVVGSSGDDPATEEQLVGLIGPKIDGLVLSPAGELGPAVIELAERRAVVVMDRGVCLPGVPSVVLDNRASAERATRVLLDNGHRRIALVNGPLRVSTARERLAGYETALTLAGAEVMQPYIRSCEFLVAAGLQATTELLRLPERPDAIFSSSAILTLGVISALREHGLRWPDDIAVVGLGDATWASLVDPPLTVIEQPKAELGRRTAEMLLAAVRGARSTQQLTLASRLVLRESHWSSNREAVA
jgi:DNA-binding LacI/PurR family transcriptional regulator